MTRSTTAKQLGHWNTPTFHSNVKGQLSEVHKKKTKAHTLLQKKAMSPKKDNTRARALRKKEGDGYARIARK